MSSNKKITAAAQETLLSTLKLRFEKNMNRHEGLKWQDVQAKLEKNPEKLWSLMEMERTEGEPDVVEYDVSDNTYVFYDCAAESPKGRRSFCYDRKALDARKENKPKSSVLEEAENMGIQLLDEQQYRNLQKLGTFDTKTSSWISSPAAIRNLGGALFGDRRYNQVFIYHNGAESYYAARGFRGLLKV
ncbi:DUF4256 domain-containing protein [Pedobacter aquatilis]|uniref:DUF4256 domain-containing protein n=1 Tax=Pedobacter aquatilis TaxID=351343 RepID=UPI00292F09F3|nr:DUF4256 domain-containing protein [Pedobacter aquatilis]